MRTLFVSMLVAIALVSCKQSVKGKNGVSYKSAVEYNDYIVNRQMSLMRNIIEFGKMSDINIDSAEALLRKYAREAGQMIVEIKGMPAYKGDSSLRDAAVSSFTFYKRIFEKDYLEILDIRRKGEENVTEEDVSKANAIVERITREEEGYDKTFHEAQEAYAKRHHMKLMDNAMQKEIDKLDKE